MQIALERNVPHVARKVWLSDIGRMAEVRNVPHLALQGVSTTFYTSFIIRRSPVLLYSHLASKVRYISFQRNLQLKISWSSYHFTIMADALPKWFVTE